MFRRAFLASAASPLLLSLSCKDRPVAAIPREVSTALQPVDRELVLDAMLRATRFLTETVGYRGGYLWAYLPDFSRCWGELEARRSMLWVQPPGTPSVGHLLLDALHATGDELYFRAALDTARALISAQRPSGGWNYVYDFEGEPALAQWYTTVARNAWRMEEFHHHPDSATFDDSCTSAATQFLLRLQLEPALAALPEAGNVATAVGKALRLIRLSQYPSGGWPQRHPPGDDYSRLVTFNDDVLFENLRTLLMAHAALGVPELLGPVRAAMDCVLALQQPLPQPGWGMQHDLRGKPAAARSYEPAALATHTTTANLELLMTFQELTGDPKYTRRVPEALDWLERVQLSPEQQREYGGTHPTFIELGSGDPLFVHRRGSNVVNGSYYVDKTFAPRLAHYSPVRHLDLAALRARLAALRSASAEQHPLLPQRPGSLPLPRFFWWDGPTLRDLCTGGPSARPTVSGAEALRLVSTLDPQGRWLAPLDRVSNPYRGSGSAQPYPSDTYASTNVGDRTDTSPYAAEEAPASYATEAPAGPGDPAPAPPLGISVAQFIRNQLTLLAYATPAD
ncbi:MAG: hypothetical protein RL033_7812 [Pseudomonadota bacterium]